jgi:hypothetical protein
MQRRTILLVLCFQITHCSLKLYTFKKHVIGGKEHPIIVINSSRFMSYVNGIIYSYVK